MWPWMRGARQSIDHDTALRRMESAGVILTTTETAMFEWCRTADTPEFKKISALSEGKARRRNSVLTDTNRRDCSTTLDVANVLPVMRLSAEIATKVSVKLPILSLGAVTA